MAKQKLVLLDFSNIMYSSFFNIVGNCTDNDIIFNERVPLWKHLILNSIVSYARKFRVDTKNIILCFDEKYVWRNDIFKHYKKNRKKGRDDSGIDFRRFFTEMEVFKTELNENFPLMSLQVKKAEADDTIYILAKKLSVKYDIIVASMDKDLIQVLQFDNVQFYNIKRKGGKWINIDKRKIPEMLEIHILRGDASDGIPNFLSDEDTYMAQGKRCKPLTEKKIAKILEMGVDSFIVKEEIKDRYLKNATLIDMSFIPKDIEKNIEKEFIKEMKKDKSWKKAIIWLKANKMKNILNDLDRDFLKDCYKDTAKNLSKWTDKIKKKENNSLF